MSHLTKPPAEKTIVVIGAGILGLTSALRLQETFSPAGANVLVVAAEFPHGGSHHTSPNYASSWAGAHHRYVPVLTAEDARFDRLARVSFDVLHETAARHPEAGIEFMDGYEYFERPSQNYVQLRGGYGSYEGFRVLDESELPDGVRFGAVYKTWCLNPPVYCGFLLRRFLLGGGKLLKKRLLRPEEAFSLANDVDVVVNCSGSGFGDPAYYPIRGQTCLVSNPCDRTITKQNADGSWTFLIPRPLEGGTIVGGTKQPHDWMDTPSLEIRNKILESAAKMYPPILNKDGQFEVVRDIVGRRPARDGGLRLETEQVVRGPLGAKGKIIIHAYGAAGSGYELSWGVAQEVVKMTAKRRREVKL